MKFILGFKKMKTDPFSSEELARKTGQSFQFTDS